jgi:hypothetical protein
MATLALPEAPADKGVGGFDHPVGAGAATNVAVTEVACDTVTLQVLPLAALQAPPQACKLWPAAALAVRVTRVPVVTSALQVAPQSMPAGCELTLPLPVTATAKLKRAGGGGGGGALPPPPPPPPPPPQPPRLASAMATTAAAPRPILFLFPDIRISPRRAAPKRAALREGC